MKMCCCNFFSIYFVSKLNKKSFVSTSFHVCGDLNIQNKVLNLNTSLEEVLLLPAFA